MKDTDIQIGKCYDIKAGKNITAVRIMKPAPKGGWEALNLASNNPVVIRSAGRIIGLHNPKAGKKEKPAAIAFAKPDKPLSALDAAIKVLYEAGAPMNCKQMIETMVERGYWKPGQGKTPVNTLHAAISKEIKVKGPKSRFEKSGRGLFAIRNTE